MLLLPLLLLAAGAAALAPAARPRRAGALHVGLGSAPAARLGAGGDPTRGFHAVLRAHVPLGDGEVAREESAREGFHVVPLYGGMVAVGEYYAKVHIGGQMVRVQIDTGSATLAVPLAGCASCLRGDKRYDVEKSSGKKGKVIGCEDTGVCTAGRCNSYSCGKCSASNACCSRTSPDNCGFHLNFGDGSGAQGYLVRDDLTWGGVSFPVTFGGINKDSPDFERAQVDGILGMAYPPLACNPSCVQPTFDAMIDHLGMRDIFQICITSDSGRIVLGDWDKSLMKTAPTWVDMSLSSPPTYYTIKLAGDLQIGGKPVVLPRYKLAIADSGTTLLVFTKSAFAAILAHLQANHCDVPGLCGDKTWFRPAHCTVLTDEDRAKMPSLKFDIEGGFSLEFGPDEYLINYASKGPQYWCVGLMSLNALAGGIDVIFGNTAMKKYVTIYDRERSRLGFGLSNGDCKSDKDGVAAAPAVTQPAPAPAAVAATAAQPAPAQPTPAQPGAVAGQGDASVFKSASCESASDCLQCAEVEGVQCAWDSDAAKCEVGDRRMLMCTVELVSKNIALAIGIASAVVAVVVALICCCICVMRKRQSVAQEDAVDLDEAFESRLPLAPVRDGPRDSVVRDNEEVETF